MPNQRALAVVLSLAAAAPAQTVDLHVVRVAPRGDVVVVYSKDFDTCAHLLTPSLQILHSSNVFCTRASNVAGVFPGTTFNANLVVGNPVHLCHGNNYNLCSPLVTVTAGATLSADRWSLSLQRGGTQAFTLDAGSASAGRGYLLLGSASGTAGFTFRGLNVPLTPDGYFAFTLTSPNTFPLTASLGNLDAAGQAAASLTLPAGLSPALIGVVLHHAFVELAPAGPVRVSNAWPLTLGA
ncbi:MAG: hypothetical protein R3F56_26465 [Planctomycetota bacterium]